MDPPSYTEKDLLFLYEDLLELPQTDRNSQPDPAALKQAQAEQDLSVVNVVDQRLYSATPLEDGQPQNDLCQVQNLTIDTKSLEPSVQPYRRVLSRAHDIVCRVESVRSSLVDGAVQVRQDFVPISVLSIPEYESLIRVCVGIILFLCRTFLIYSRPGSSKRW